MRSFLLVIVGLLIFQTSPVWADDEDAQRTLGKADAPITIIEYASMTCPHCAHFEETVLPSLKEKYLDTGKAKLIFRDFPLDQVALRGAMVARCAPPERFYAYIGAMFRNQKTWAFASDPMAGLARLAKLGGMSQERFDACMADKSVEEAVLRQRLGGSTQFNIEATPTIIINGKKAEKIGSFEDLDAILKPLASK